MCTGLEIAAIAGTVASVAGTAVSQVSASQQQKAMTKANNQVVDQYMRKNKALAEESRGIFDQRLSEEDQLPVDEAKPASDNRTDLAGGMIDATRVTAPLRGSAPQVVQDAAAATTQQVDQKGRERARALADVESLGDMLFGKSLKTADAAQDIGMIGGFARDSANQVGTNAQLAQIGAMNKGRGLGMLGSGLSALGSLGSAAAGSGYFDGMGGMGGKAGSVKTKMRF